MSLVELRNVSLAAGRAQGAPRVLREIDLSIGRGEALGLVGESGSGKSMTMRTIARMLPSDWTLEGRIDFDGRDLGSLRGAALRDFQAREIGTVFQDPRAFINPVHRIGYYLTESMRFALGCARSAAEARAVELLHEVGLSDPERRMRQYPHQLSGGQLQRIMIAGALAAKPRLILADEPTTALDVTTQAEIVALLDRTRRASEASMLFITHDLDLANAVCDRVAVMYAGEIVEIRWANALESAQAHPYTAALYDARPSIDRKVATLRAVPGLPLSPFDAPSAACAFAARCEHTTEACLEKRPPLADCPDGSVRCVHSAQVLRERMARVAEEHS